MVGCVASIVTLVLNYILYKKEFKEVIKIFKGIFRRKRKNQV
jgi:hypothetical protein